MIDLEILERLLDYKPPLLNILIPWGYDTDYKNKMCKTCVCVCVYTHTHYKGAWVYLMRKN